LLIKICFVIIISSTIFLSIQYFFNTKQLIGVPETLSVYTNPVQGVEIAYPKKYVRSTLTTEDTQAGIFFRITRDVPAAMFSIRYQKGFGAMKLLGGSTLETFTEEVNRRYPERFPEYKKERYERIVLANENAVLIEFSYLGKDNVTRIKQRLIFFIHNNAAYFLSSQAKVEDFNVIEKEFTKIVGSFAFLD